jgi:hypothetical protein
MAKSSRVSGKSFDPLPRSRTGVPIMLYKIDKTVPKYVWVLQRMKANEFILTLKMDVQNSALLAFFILDRIRAAPSYYISLFQKDQGC